MNVISIIERPDVVKKILQHLGLWDRKARLPPKTTDPNARIDWKQNQTSGGSFSLDPQADFLSARR